VRRPPSPGGKPPFTDPSITVSHPIFHVDTGVRGVNARRGPRRGLTAALVFGASLSLYCLTAGGSLTSTDAVVTFALAKSLVERRSFALDERDVGNSAARGVDGRYYSHFGLGKSLYDIPFYVAGRAIGRAVPARGGKADMIPKAAVALGSAVAAACAVMLVWLLAVELTGAPRAALAAAAAAAIGSPLWPYSKFGLSTALTTAILCGAAYAVWKAATTQRLSLAAAAGAVFAFGWLTRHEMALLLPPFLLVFAMEARERPASTTLGAIAVFAGVSCSGGLLWMLYNAVRFGRPFAVGYSPTFGVAGYAAYVASPAGSVLLYCPIAVAAAIGVWTLGRGSASRALLLGSPLAIGYLFYGSLVDWPGGRSYGPRYLVPALVLLTPGVAALVATRRLRLATAAALVAACAVLQLPGVLVDYSKVSIDWAGRASHADLESRNWRIDESPLVLGTAASVRAVENNAAWLTGLRALPPAPAAQGPGDRAFAQQLSYSLDAWWAYLVYLRAISRTTALGAAGLLLAVAVAAAVSAWNVASDPGAGDTVASS
jgi:hypothetical protein